MIPHTTAQTLAAAQTWGLERIDAQLLLLHVLGKSHTDRAWLLAHDSDVLDSDVTRRFEALAKRRAAGEPLAYLVGYKEFFGLNLLVDPRVLIPRPDTETLVNWSLEVLQQMLPQVLPQMLPQVLQKQLQSDTRPADASVLDLGTGSGAIALALAHQLQTAAGVTRITAADASLDALAVARQNAARLQLDVSFIESSWLEKVSGHFHLIASNPPYVADADPHLDDLKHEPLKALTAGADGLDDIRQIIGQAPAHLHPGGWLVLEHGFDQALKVRELLAQRGFLQVQSRLDLAGIERCSGGQWASR
jgi:release factor glutamine methyltransferase